MMSGFQVGQGLRQRHISRTESTSDLATEAKKLMEKLESQEGSWILSS